MSAIDNLKKVFFYIHDTQVIKIEEKDEKRAQLLREMVNHLAYYLDHSKTIKLDITDEALLLNVYENAEAMFNQTRYQSYLPQLKSMIDAAYPSQLLGKTGLANARTSLFKESSSSAHDLQKSSTRIEAKPLYSAGKPH